MHLKMTLLFFTLSIYCTAQKRVNKIGVYVPSSFYSYGESAGSLNNVVRHSEAMAFKYKTYDTVKKKGMVYELLFSNPDGYYKNILGPNTTLRVNDVYINVNFIFPVVLFYTKSMEHFIGVGIGAGTLAYRDYMDENNSELAYNITSLKELKFGKYWTSNFILDYDFDVKLSRRIGLNLGIRYFTSIPFIEKTADYKVTQGTGLTFKYGLFYQFR